MTHVVVLIVSLCATVSLSSSISLSELEKGEFLDEYVLKISNDNDISTVLEKAVGFNVKKRIFGNVFWLVGTEQSNTRTNSNETISKLVNDPKVDFLQQQKRLKRVVKASPNDAEWNNMWFLNGVMSPSMKTTEAWNLGFTGNGIVVALVDDGLETSHPDLDANVDTTSDYDVVDDDDDPTPSDGDYHGTLCAGLIVAEKDNGLCIVGVAFDASLIGIRLLGGDYLTDAMESTALSHALSMVDIYSNSWGPTDGYGYDGPGDITELAMQEAVTNGRNGRGSIFVWAAGNGEVTDNCNADGYVNSIYTIAITSIGHNLEPAWYSEVCAPALAATFGGGGGDYVISTTTGGVCSEQTLQGTSMATPLASGIIALTLEANPLLTWRDVQHLIVRTSKNAETVEPIEEYGWEMNGAGLFFSHRLGYGLMDAEAMVTESQKWTNVPEQISCESEILMVMETVSYISSVKSIINGIPGCRIKYIEHVKVRVHFEAAWLGVMTMKLTSPKSTVSYLLTQRPNDDSFVADVAYWDFMSVHFWGESPDGSWTLTASISDMLKTGDISYWQLQMTGTEEINEPYPVVYCADPPTVGDSTVQFTSTEYRSTAVYTCQDGHVPSGGATISCQADGSWTTYSLICTYVDCGLPFLVQNTILAVAMTTYGNIARYVCDAGFTASGSDTITCQADGNWSHLMLKCPDSNGSRLRQYSLLLMSLPVLLTAV